MRRSQNAQAMGWLRCRRVRGRMRAVSWVLTCVVGLLFSQGAGGRAVRMCECIVVHSSAQRAGMRGEAILPEPPGSARGVPRAPRLVERGCRGVQ